MRLEHERWHVDCSWFLTAWLTKYASKSVCKNCEFSSIVEELARTMYPDPHKEAFAKHLRSYGGWWLLKYTAALTSPSYEPSSEISANSLEEMEWMPPKLVIDFFGGDASLLAFLLLLKKPFEHMCSKNMNRWGINLIASLTGYDNSTQT